MKGGGTNGAGILLQMSDEEGDEEPAERHLKKQETGDAWNLSSLRNQAISNWQELVCSVLF
jgi:hypothetical protein